MGGAALGGDPLAQQRRRLVGAAAPARWRRRRWPAPACGPGPRSGPCRRRPASWPRRSRRHRPGPSRTVRSPRPGPPRAPPTAAGRWAPAPAPPTRARPASTASRAYSPAMPWPISAGVLGMARTTRSLPVARAMASLRMPAITLSCSAPSADGVAGIQPGDALADQRRRVGHGTDDALAAGGTHDRRAADAGHHAELQGLADEGRAGRGRLGEELRLDRPDRPGRSLASAAPAAACTPTPNCCASLSRCASKGSTTWIDDARAAGLQQAADERAGHVAAADEGDAGRVHALSVASRPGGGGLLTLRACASPRRARHALATDTIDPICKP